MKVNMSHDPLCAIRGNYPTIPEGTCECELIDQVRQEERKQAAQRVEALRYWQGATVEKYAAAARGDYSGNRASETTQDNSSPSNGEQS